MVYNNTNNNITLFLLNVIAIVGTFNYYWKEIKN